MTTDPSTINRVIYFMERVVTEPLAEKYRDFGTLKSRIRELLGTDTRLRLLGAPKYNDDKNFFECPEVHQQLYVSDEIDIAIEKAALAGGRTPTRIDFLRRAPGAGWFQAMFGVTPLPRPATEGKLGVQHGASLVYSQNEIDGTVIVLLYPPQADRFRRSETCIILGYFKSPRFVDNTKIRKHVDALIRYQKVVAFGQNPKIGDRFYIWWLIKTKVVIWEGAAEPTHLKRSEWLTAYAKKIISTSTVMAAALLVVYIVGKFLLSLGFTTLATILLRRPAP
jgi:hypothetical protein